MADFIASQLAASTNLKSKSTDAHVSCVTGACIVASSMNSPISNLWFLDSGASRHIGNYLSICFLMFILLMQHKLCWDCLREGTQ